MSFEIHKTLQNYHDMDCRIKFSDNHIMPFIQSLGLLYCTDRASANTNMPLSQELLNSTYCTVVYVGFLSNHKIPVSITILDFNR